MSTTQNCAVNISGSGDQTLVFLHGYGCDSSMWRKLLPSFEPQFRVVTYDLMGYGKSAIKHYDPARYGTLAGHVDDLIGILEENQLKDVVAIGHSVSAMIVGLAAERRPDLIARLVMICPSPSYANDGAYQGGFELADLHGLLDILDVNYLGWAREMAPQIMGTPDQPEHGAELTESFCRTDPDIAKHFARVTFLYDHRDEVKAIRQPTLVLQCRDDILVPPAVWDWLTENMQNIELVVLDGTGHCPHVSYPEATTAAITAYLQPQAAQ